MSLLSIAVVLLWTIAVAALALYVAGVAGSVTYVTLADGRRQARSLPLTFKLLLPLAGNCQRIVNLPRFAEHCRLRDRRLVAAGFEGLIDGRDFLALEVLSPLVVGSLWLLLISLLAVIMPSSPFASAWLPLVLFGYALFAVQPELWLRSVLKARHLAIMRSLPFVLDVLTLSVEAGMDFISALQRNCASRKLDALNEELLRMTREIQVGLSRKEALRAMADRVGQSDLKAVAIALVQADELGVPIGSVLRIQSEQLRSRRFDRAERLANEAPTKMLGPLMLCIFPAVFIILLGPVLSQALKGMF